MKTINKILRLFPILGGIYLAFSMENNYKWYSKYQIAYTIYQNVMGVLITSYIVILYIQK